MMVKLYKGFTAASKNPERRGSKQEQFVIRRDIAEKSATIRAKLNRRNGFFFFFFNLRATTFSINKGSILNVHQPGIKAVTSPTRRVELSRKLWREVENLLLTEPGLCTNHASTIQKRIQNQCISPHVQQSSTNKLNITYIHHIRDALHMF